MKVKNCCMHRKGELNVVSNSAQERRREHHDGGAAEEGN